MITLPSPDRLLIPSRQLCHLLNAAHRATDTRPDTYLAEYVSTPSQDHAENRLVIAPHAPRQHLELPLEPPQPPCAVPSDSVQPRLRCPFSVCCKSGSTVAGWRRSEQLLVVEASVRTEGLDVNKLAGSAVVHLSTKMSAGRSRPSICTSIAALLPAASAKTVMHLTLT